MKIAKCCDYDDWLYVFCVVLSITMHIEPVNIVVIHFGWWGIKIGFLDEIGFESSWVFELPEEASLKRATTVAAQNCFVIVLSSVSCNAPFYYLIILLDDMVYVYILYGFDGFVTYMWRICDVFVTCLWRVTCYYFIV